MELGQESVSDAVIEKLKSKKLLMLTIFGQSYHCPMLDSVACLIESISDTLENLVLFLIDIKGIMLNRKQFSSLVALRLEYCKGDLASILHICPNLQRLEVLECEMKLGPAQYSLSSLQHLNMDDESLSDNDKSKFCKKLPEGISRDRT